MAHVITAPRPMLEDEPQPESPSLGRGPFLIALLAVALMFVVLIAPRVNLEPGDSHDGRNAGLWTVGARSLLENGPIESRLGAWAPERAVYANHPPGVTWETAAFLATTGTSPWSRKAPAYLSSIAAIGLAAVLLRRLGFSRGATIGGVALMATTPMMLVFGASPNMEAASLPWVFLALIAWADPDHPHAPFAAGVGVVGCAWMFHGSLLLAVVLGAMSLLRLVRGRETAIDRRMVICALPAGLLLGAWFTWANGGLSGLLAQGGNRSSLGDVGLGAWLDRQNRYLDDVFGWPLLLLVAAGLVVALRSTTGHQRTTVALAAGVPLAYLALTVDGAWHHEYWNYLWLVPIAVGSAALIDAAQPFDSPLRRIGPPAVVGLLIFLGTTTLPPAHHLFFEGADAADLLVRTELPADQEIALTYPLVVGPLSWVSWETRLRAENLAGPEALTTWAQARPEDHVLVDKDGIDYLHGPGMWPAVASLAGGSVEGDYALVDAAGLARLADAAGLDPALPDDVLGRLAELAEATSVTP